MAEARRVLAEQLAPHVKTVAFQTPNIAATSLTNIAQQNGMKGFALNWNQDGDLPGKPVGGTLVGVHEIVAALLGAYRVDYTFGDLRFQFPLWVLVGISKSSEEKAVKALASGKTTLDVEIKSPVMVHLLGADPERCVALFTNETLCRETGKETEADSAEELAYVPWAMRSAEEARVVLTRLCDQREQEIDGFAVDARGHSGERVTPRALLTAAQMQEWLKSPNFRIMPE